MYQYHKFILASLFVPLCLFLIFARDVQAQKQLQSLSLATNGQTKYVIAMAQDAIPAEKTAAQQLQKYLEQMTQASFAIKDADTVPADAPQILVGPGARAKALLPNMNWKKLGHDGIVIKTVGNKLVIAGGRPRGTIYAAFEFLKSLGCRWWTPTASTIPHKSLLTITAQNVVYIPPFTMRGNSAIQGYRNPVFSTIMHENGYYLKQGKAWGGHLVQLRCSFANLLPPKKYFKQHPQWYTDPLNGDRPSTAETKMPTSRKVWQLDTTNPQAIKAYTKQAIVYIHNHPEGDTIAIWFQDNPHYCKSPRAMKIIRAQDSPAGLMMQFTNQVAKQIHQVYPDYPVQMQAYWWTSKPPKTMRPGPGVVIDLAAFNKLAQWSKIAQQLHTWYYCTDFRWALFPQPDWNVLGKDIRRMANHHVVGAYLQGNARPGAGNFIELRIWLLGHLLWNPYQSQEKLTHEFLTGYYGKAGPYLGQYLNLVQKAFTKSGQRLWSYNSDFSFMSLKVTNQAIGLFNQAEAAVKNNPALLRRVQRSRLSLDAVVLAKFQYFHRQAQLHHIVFLGPDNLAKALATFEENGKRSGIKQFSIGTRMLLRRLHRRVAKYARKNLPDFAQGYKPTDVVVYPADDIHMNSPGTYSNLVDDPAATTGKAAMMIGSAPVQALQVRIGPSLPARHWHIYISARLDAAPDAKMTGAGFSAGIKDLNKMKMITDYKFPMSKAAGKTYHWFDLGVHELDGGKEIRFAGLGRKDVKQIYINRVIFIRAGAKKK